MIYLKTSVGIEIRQEDLLITSLQSNFTSGVFTHYTRIANFRTRDKQEVRREVDVFFKSRRLSRENIIIGIPRSDIVIRHLDLPAEVADNLKQVVLYQVQTFEPTEEEKFYYDYVQLKSNQNDKRLFVLLVMIKKAILDAYLANLKDIGIKPACVTGGSVGLANMLLQGLKEQPRATFMVADLRPAGIEVFALRDGTLAYSRETAKEDLSWKDLLIREVEEAASKIRLGPDDTIEQILLAGDVPEGTYEEIHDAVPECELTARSIRLEMPPELRPSIVEASSSLGLAYSGLVRRPALKLNLLPNEMRDQQTRWAYVPSIILGIAILGLLGALALRPIVQDRILIRKLDQEIQALKGRVDRVQAIRTQSEGLQKRISFVEGLVYNRDMNLEVLQELTAVLPNDTFLNMYQNTEGSIQISGSSASAPDLIPKLDKSPLLKDCVQRGTIFKDAQTAKDRFTFECKLER